jgi:hypothetical protein
VCRGRRSLPDGQLSATSFTPLGALVAIAAAAALAVPAAHASQGIARDATDVRLDVDGAGRALVTYTTRGRRRSVLAWGAINALPPRSGVPQVRFQLDYAARGRYGSATLRRQFRGGCGAYDGPALAWLVAVCKAPDGSYWALQSWRRLLPAQGRDPAGIQRSRELRLSHWRGELPVLAITLGWVHGRYHHISGSLTYRGTPVYGFAAKPSGSPLDTYGRNIYLDTYNSAYGPGWRREGAFLTYRPTGVFCWGFFSRNGRPSGMGEAYRATVIGPGVTPDVTWRADAHATGRSQRCAR